jgi:lipopolysaccharide export system protein LptA
VKWLSGILLLLALAWPDDARAQESALVRNNQPIKLKSDHLATDTSNRTATFTGRVVAQQGDLTVQADRLVVRYAEKGNDVDEVLATGNVRITQGERSASAGRAVYDNAAGIMKLEDNPRVQQGEDTIVGATITYYVNELKSVVVGGPGQRVEAVIRPGGEQKRVPGAK